MVRRLTVSLMLLTCLLGMIQPALACVAPTDCCSTGCGRPMHPGAGWVETSDCCATAAVVSSVSITAQARHALDPASGSPAVTAGPADLQLARYPNVLARLPATQSPVDQSHIYLRTARLRL